MSCSNKKTAATALVELLTEKDGKEAVIAELFSLFGINCITRWSMDNKRLDTLIEKFMNSREKTEESLSEIIELLSSADSDLKKRENKLLEKIKSFTAEKLTEEMSVEEIASELNLSYYYMCHFFKEHTGISFSEFRNKKRIEEAIKILCSTDRKISDVATACGFNGLSYFTEVFTRLTGKAPTAFKKENKMKIHGFWQLEDIKLAMLLEQKSFLSESPRTLTGVKVSESAVFTPDERFKFLHETAVIAFKDVLYAAWYFNPETELHGYTPICFSRSVDGGKSWTAPETVADDKTERLLYCPPVFGICDGKLYMLMNSMVGPDLIHSLDLYLLNEQTQEFEFLYSKSLPFKLNTNVVTLPNGKLMLPGRVAKLDGFPNTPAVLISDSGKIDAEWRLVKIAPNGDLPDGEKLVHPEISVIVSGDTLHMFCRNDNRKVPLVYTSHDLGESWELAAAHDIPYISSKIYTGTLSNGQNYLIANEYVNGGERSRLSAYFSEKGKMCFDRRLVLADYSRCDTENRSCHYPAACEYNGRLCVLASRDIEAKGRGAVFFSVDISEIS